MITSTGIYQGSLTATIFLDFVKKKVFPHCTPYSAGGPRSVLVLDNARIHHSRELKDACDEAGILLEFLPPYSPEFNPIETSFALLKAWIRRNTDAALQYTERGDFGTFLNIAMKTFESVDDARKLFMLACIKENEEDIVIPRELRGFYDYTDNDNDSRNDSENAVM